MTLSVRDDDLRELMDDPACDPVALRRTLVRFGVVNRLVSGWGTVYRRHLRPILAARASARRGDVTLLDIGCGGGDVLRRLADAARADGMSVAALGIDPDDRGFDAARARSDARTTYRTATVQDLVAEGRSFDVVVSNHVLHHLGRDEIRKFLSDSATLSSGVAAHSDIARSRTAYAAYAVAITPFAPGTFLRTDGLRSIRRSFTPLELSELAPPAWRIERPVPFRLLAVHGGGADA